MTLRGLRIAEVVDVAVGAGLSAVEWGGDVHVPPGDLHAAAEARRSSTGAGLAVVSYGSYLSCTPKVGSYVDAVLDTVEALGTSLVRVWCPSGVEPGAAAEARAEVADAVATVAEAAAARDLDIYLEFHGGTLTASAPSTVALLDAVGAPNVYTAWQAPYWQPQDLDADLDDLRALQPRLAHVHIYEWDPDGRRHPLAAGEASWPTRLAAASPATPGWVGTPPPPLQQRAALLEFVTDDDPAALAADAATLRRWLSQLDADLPRLEEQP